MIFRMKRRIRRWRDSPPSSKLRQLCVLLLLGSTALLGVAIRLSPAPLWLQLLLYAVTLAFHAYLWGAVASRLRFNAQFD